MILLVMLNDCVARVTDSASHSLALRSDWGLALRLLRISTSSSWSLPAAVFALWDGRLLLLLLRVLVLLMLALIFGSAFAEADDASRLYPASACTTFVLLFFGGFEEDAAGESTPSSYEEEEEDKRVLSAAAPRLRFWLKDVPFPFAVATFSSAVFASVFFALAVDADAILESQTEFASANTVIIFFVTL